MTMYVEVDHGKLNTAKFLELVDKVWPGNYDPVKTEKALSNTINVCAWGSDNQLLGCVRLLTDGYFYSTITEILVLPEHQRKGVGTALMQKVFEISPSSLAFGVQKGNEAFFEKLGYIKGLDTYQKKKSRS